MLMYYGGDLIDLALIVLLCRQWYAATRPRPLPRPCPAATSARMTGQRPFVTEKPCATHTFG
jgi:hypothetical protein